MHVIQVLGFIRQYSIIFSILKTGLLSFKPIYFDDLNIQRNKMVPEGRWWNHKDMVLCQTTRLLVSYSLIHTYKHKHAHHTPTYPQMFLLLPSNFCSPQITQSKLCTAEPLCKYVAVGTTLRTHQRWYTVLECIQYHWW